MEKIKKMKYLSILTILLATSQIVLAQNGSIGMGTETPNPNAVLDLVAPDGNQGLLVPRLSTTQRTDPEFISNLSDEDNGLLVLDSTLNIFFYWDVDDWVTFEGGSVLTQNLSFDDQTFELSITDGNTISLSPILDAVDSDETNELQTLTFSNDTLFLSNNGGSVGIDTSSVNEIQDLDLTGSILTITNNSSATPIDLSGFGGGGSAQTLTFDPDTDSLFISGGNGVGFGDWINENDADSTNELQTLSFDEGSNSLSISDGNSIDLSNWISENDADSTNEIQDLQIIDDTLSITGNTSATELDLTKYLNTDEQNLSWSSADLELTIDGGNTVELTGISKWSSIGTSIVYNGGNVRIGRGIEKAPTSSVINFTGSGGSLSAAQLTAPVIYVGSTDPDGGTITTIAAGANGQEIILIGAGPSGSARLQNSLDTDTGDNLLFLGASSRTLFTGDVIKLIYVSTLDNLNGNLNGSGYWLEVSYSNNFLDTIIGKEEK